MGGGGPEDKRMSVSFTSALLVEAGEKQPRLFLSAKNIHTTLHVFATSHLWSQCV
jgi:hypothetical protein